eukprot:COSAG01_NODE_40_length_32708_cov_25.641234_21_plen_132_part_00
MSGLIVVLMTSFIETGAFYYSTLLLSLSVVKCLVHVETALRHTALRWVRAHSCEMGGLCCSQRSPHSRLVAHSGPVRLFCFFFPPSAPLMFLGPVLVADVACDYFWLYGYVFGSCGFSEVSSNLVDGDTIS